MYDFSFLPTDTFKLIDVTDHAGTSKVNSKELYSERVGCTAQNIRQIEFEYNGDTYTIIEMDFVQDAAGRWTNLHLRTSPVIDIKQGSGLVEIRTYNSIYVMEPATLVPASLQNATDLIELYLTTEGNRFAKGFFYDAEGHAHELVAFEHLGLIVDTCLIHFPRDDVITGIVCRYYIDTEKVEFYNTLQRRQDYSRPILIHNNSSGPLLVEFEESRDTWLIDPWGEMLIAPFDKSSSEPHIPKADQDPPH